MNHSFYKHVRKTATTQPAFFMSHLGFHEIGKEAILSDFLIMNTLRVKKIVVEGDDTSFAHQELIKEMNNNILSLIVKAIERPATESAISSFSAISKFFYDHFGFISKRNSRNIDKLLSHIKEVGEKIVDESGPVNFIIIPSRLKYAFESSQEFVMDQCDIDSILSRIGRIGAMEVFVFNSTEIDDKILIGCSFENSSMLDKVVYVEGTEEFHLLPSLQGPDSAIPHKIYLHTKNVCVANLTQAEKCFRTIFISK